MPAPRYEPESIGLRAPVISGRLTWVVIGDPVTGDCSFIAMMDTRTEALRVYRPGQQDQEQED
jgi:hypothetical protein